MRRSSIYFLIFLSFFFPEKFEDFHRFVNNKRINVLDIQKSSHLPALTELKSWLSAGWDILSGTTQEDQPDHTASVDPVHRSDEQLQAFVKEAQEKNSPPYFVRPTMGRPPQGNAMAGKYDAVLPVGVVLQPLARVPAGQSEVPCVNCTDGTIMRCASCRTYINPFVKWGCDGRYWICNLCGFSQETRSDYVQLSSDENGKPSCRNLCERPELSTGAVEYIVPSPAYTLRPPQPPVYFFVIDVSYSSVRSGFVDAAVTGIKQVIQSASAMKSGGARMQVGIITFDSSVHFYNILRSGSGRPEMLQVGEVDDIFLPLHPDYFLVNATEGKSKLLKILDQLPGLFHQTEDRESCMGAAMKAAYMAMKHVGGKLLVFAGAMPTIGFLSLKPFLSTNSNACTDVPSDLHPAKEVYIDFA